MLTFRLWEWLVAPWICLRRGHLFFTPLLGDGRGRCIRCGQQN